MNSEIEMALIKAMNNARVARFADITEYRVKLLDGLKKLDEKDIIGSYRHTLERLVRNAGVDGISLALVKQVLPDPVILQQARNELGSETYIIGKGTHSERRAEGEKLIDEGKGATKGNTRTLYPGENMKEEPKVDHDSDAEGGSEVVAV